MPRHATHPGELLAGELQTLGISPNELARQLNVPNIRIHKILQCKSGINVDIALRLGQWLGRNPQFWLNLQSAYDLRLAREAAAKNPGAGGAPKTGKKKEPEPPPPPPVATPRKRIRKLSAEEMAAFDALDEKPDAAAPDTPEADNWDSAVCGGRYWPVKQIVSMRLDADILEWFRARHTRGYQGRMNAILREYMLREQREEK
jgi:addiction module HigA family antidote